MSTPFYAVVSPDGRLRFHDDKPSLEDLQAAVGGDVETFPAPNGGLVYLNEEGKLDGLRRNTLATNWLHEFLMDGDYIAGPIVVAGSLDERGEETALTATQIRDLKVHFIQ